MNLDSIIKINEQLYGAPEGVLVMIFAILLGYLLKTLPFINNNYIPFTVVCFCTVIFMIAAPARAEGTELRIWLVRNFIIGFIIGAASWQFHYWILRKFIDPKLFNDDGSTKFLNKPPTNSNP